MVLQQLNLVISEHIKNNLFSLKVIPNSSRNFLKEENGKLKLYLKAVPEKGKANGELINFFKKECHLKVKVKHGMTSRKKVIEVLN
jgi:uncharacterized protein (TIGR00251 family)